MHRLYDVRSLVIPRGGYRGGLLVVRIPIFYKLQASISLRRSKKKTKKKRIAVTQNNNTHCYCDYKYYISFLVAVVPLLRGHRLQNILIEGFIIYIIAVRELEIPVLRYLTSNYIQYKSGDRVIPGTILKG